VLFLSNLFASEKTLCVEIKAASGIKKADPEAGFLYKQLKITWKLELL
jgi:hypothetical protein